MTKPYTVKDACNFIFLTNNYIPIKIPNDDRRFFCVEMSSKYANNTEYFSNLHNELDKEEYLNSFYDFFKNIDISNYDFISNRPVSDMYDDMRELNIPVVIRFLENYIWDTLNNIDIKPYWIDAGVLFSKLITYMSENNFNNITYTPVKFWY